MPKRKAEEALEDARTKPSGSASRETDEAETKYVFAILLERREGYWAGAESSSALKGVFGSAKEANKEALAIIREESMYDFIAEKTDGGLDDLGVVDVPADWRSDGVGVTKWMTSKGEFRAVVDEGEGCKVTITVQRERVRSRSKLKTKSLEEQREDVKKEVF